MSKLIVGSRRERIQIGNSTVLLQLGKRGKSLFTPRSWWTSGLEMTLAGVMIGGATLAIGLAFA